MAAAENSFDITCKLEMQEVSNAINQAKREIETRYDLKGSKNDIAQEKMDIVLSSPDDMKLKAVLDILQSKLHRRGIDLKALTIHDPTPAGGGTLRQRISLQDGIPQEKAKEIVRLIKDSKLKVQASIQENQVRVSGKNRDDLQAVIAMVKAKDMGIALQFTNYRST
jgi:cyclic-di-GMP-binding protein